MSITSNANSTFLNVDNAHLRVSGDIHATSVKVGAIEIVPGYSLESTTGIGNTTPHTVEFTNTETSLVTSGDINMLHSSNNAAIKLNSNVVTEFPRSKKLIKYPRVALTQNALNNGYTVIQSGTNGTEHRKAWTLFNNDVTTDDQYHAVPVPVVESNPYNPSTGAYEPDVGYEDGLGDVAGEYVYVVMPDKIKLQGVSVHPRDGVLARSAESARFMGSNDGTNWVDLGGYTNFVWASGSQEPGNFFGVDSDGYYNYIGVVWTKVKGGSGGDTVNMAEVQFFGVPEYDPDADGVDMKVTSYPNVPNTDWLEVYYDAKNYSGSGDVQDETANNRDAAMNATFDNGEIKAFSFSGAYTSNVTTSDHGLGTGDVTYTMSYWFKRTAVAGTYDYVVMLGNGGVSYSSILMWINNNQLVLDHWSAALRVLDPIKLNKWYHVAAGHKGGDTPSFENDFIYIDGKKVTPQITQTAAPFTLAGSKLTLGSEHNGTTEFLNGKIANFRLFNRALTTDEIYQLYAYQKEYFGHGDLSMTLKAGRLGIGTSEPRAMLDVRGDVRFSNVPHIYATDDGTYDAIDTGAYINFDRVESSNGIALIGTDGTFEITEQAGAGVYYVDGSVSFHESNGTEIRNLQLYIYLNGVNHHSNSRNYGLTAMKHVTGSTYSDLGVTALVKCNVGDRIRLYGVSGSSYVNVHTPNNKMVIFKVQST